MKKMWLAMPLAVALSLTGAGFLQYGATPTGTGGARLLEQVVTRLHREAIDSVALDDIYERAARGLIRSMEDPYAALFSPQEMARFQRESMGNSYGGVGLLIEDQEGVIVVSRVFPGSPGEAAGVRTGDRIVAIDGQPTSGLKLEQVSKQLLGTPGTEVALTLAREGVTEPLSNKLVRAVVNVPSVPYAIMLDSAVGYVPLQRFNDVAATELGKALLQLKQQGATSLVLDLRGNPGGDLDESIKVANLFLPKGSEVVTVRYRSRPTEVRKTQGDPVIPDLPIVVLTDSATASASEIVAGALQDHDRAILLGTTSFGKGVVQTLYPLDGGWYLKLTNAHWYTPSGRLIHRDRKAKPDTTGGEATRPEFKSIRHARTVYGGGGIVPDVLVFKDTLATAEQVLAKALTAKPRDVNAVLTQLAKDAKPTLKADFKVTPQQREAVWRGWAKAGVPVTRAQFDAGRAYVDRLIEQRLARTVFGDSAAFRRWTPEDAQLRKALELLHGAQTTEQLFGEVVATK